jgi:E3 ubiquitin-protein ligase TRIP12
MQTCPFLFAFKTRLMHFYVTTLDRDRAMQKLIDLNANMATPSESDRQNDRFVPKLDKKKRTIARYNDLIKQTDTILNEFCVNSHPASSSASASASASTTSAAGSSHHSKPPLLEIQYEGEVGTGLGPTLEFYALVSLEVQRCEFEMWRGDKIKLDSVTGKM